MNDDVTLLAADICGKQALASSGSSHVLVLNEGSAGERRIPIGRAPALIGRIPACDIVLAGNSVSRQHCRLQLAGDEATVTDLGSTNGTFVDGNRVVGTIALHHGAALQVGAYALTYHRKTAKEIDEALAFDRDAQGVSAYVNMLLPAPILTGPVRANWLYLPTAKLSGNAFGYRFIDPSRFVGFMLDVAGVGMEGAMHSVAVLNLLRQAAVPGVDFGDPSSVLAKLNRTFPREHYRGLFFSIWYFCRDLDAKVLRYASAGSHFGILTRSDDLRSVSISANHPAIGLEPDYEFPTHSQPVAAGSTLCLLSDSACERLEPLGLHNEPDRLVRPDDADPSADIPHPMHLYNTIRQVTGPDWFDDDFSAVVFNL